MIACADGFATIRTQRHAHEIAAVVAVFTLNGKFPRPVAPGRTGHWFPNLGGTHEAQVCRSSRARVVKSRLTHSGKITMPNPAFERTRFSATALHGAAQRDCWAA